MGILGQTLTQDAVRTADWVRHVDGLGDWPTGASQHYTHLLRVTEELDAQGRATEAAIVRLLASTVSMRLSAGTASNLFHPLIRVGDRVSTLIEDYDANDVACLQVLSETVEDPWLKARLADVACVAGQGLGMKMWQYGQIAARAYFDHCEQVMCGENAVASREEMQRGLELTATYAKRDVDLHNSYWSLIEAAIHYSLAQGWPGVFFPLSELVRGRNRALGLKLAPPFEDHAARLAAQGDGYHPDNAQTCYEIAARFWERNRDDSAARRCQQAAAEVLVERARLPAQAMLKADWLAEGIAKLRQYGGDRARIRDLQEELADVRRTILDEMHLHEFPIDLGELIEHVRATVIGPTDHEGLMQLAYGIGHGATYDNVRQSVLDNNARHPLADFFVRISYNENGIPVSRRESFDRTNEAHVFQKMIEQVREIDATIAMPGIFEAIDIFNEKFEPSLNSVLLYLHQSPSVPDGHEDSIARGLTAGFNHDWLEVAAYLIPQAEAIVRNIFRRERKNTLVDRGDGTEEEMSLNQLLESAHANEVLGKDFVLQLRAILTEKSGFNLRNLYTHGLLSDDAIHNAGLYNLWWVLIRMVFFVPWGHEWMHARIKEKRRSAVNGHDEAAIEARGAAP